MFFLKSLSRWGVQFTFRHQLPKKKTVGVILKQLKTRYLCVWGNSTQSSGQKMDFRWFGLTKQKTPYLPHGTLKGPIFYVQARQLILRCLLQNVHMLPIAAAPLFILCLSSSRHHPTRVYIGLFLNSGCVHFFADRAFWRTYKTSGPARQYGIFNKQPPSRKTEPQEVKCRTSSSSSCCSKVISVLLSADLVNTERPQT